MEIMKKMSEYTYHIGLSLRIYPSDSQKKIIRMNGGASRYIYNKLVADNREIWELKKTASLSPADKERLDFLQSVHKKRVSSGTTQSRIQSFRKRKIINANSHSIMQMGRSPSITGLKKEGRCLPFILIDYLLPR